MHTILNNCEEVQEIINGKPPIIIRFGSVVFLVIIIVIFLLTLFIDYPDIIKAPFKLTTLNAPKSVNAKITGKLIRILVTEGENVVQGQILAYLESTANHESVLTLSRNLDRKVFTQLSEFSNLGEIQPYFQTFQMALRDYQSFLYDGFYSYKLKYLKKDLLDLKLLAENLNTQIKISEQDLTLAETELNAQKQLLSQKVIATLEFKREESRFLAKKLSFQQLMANVINNLSAQNAKQKEIIELQEIFSKQENIFLQAINTLKSAVDDWKMKYILVASISGKLNFSNILQEYQTIELGHEVFFITSKDQNEYGEIVMSQYNFGKIKVGQNVVIKFNAYPFQEFGVVEGKIDFISEIPINDSLFFAKIILTKGLETDMKKKLICKSGMKGSAEIITENRKLTQRLFSNFQILTSR